MEIVKINLNTDINELFKYKNDIESSLIEQNKIKEPMEIDRFIDFLDFSKSIYMEGKNKIIPFCAYPLDESTIILFHLCDEEEDLKKLTDALTVIKYNYSNLVQVSDEDMIRIDIDTLKSFIINEKFYTFKENLM